MKRWPLLAAVCLLLLCGCTSEGSTGKTGSISAGADETVVQATTFSETPSDFEMPEHPNPVKHTRNEPMVIDYTYDVDVPEQAVYYHDYVFAAVVTEIGEVYDPYWEPDYVKKFGAPPVYDPCYTKYQLRVTQVLKGDLNAGDIITARRWGYYDEELEAYLMSTDGVMPELGAEYLCLALQNSDNGIYGLSDPNTLIPLEGADRNTIIETYISACQNAVPTGAETVPVSTNYDYAALYTQVLEDLWNTDPGLNSEIRYISVDLSEAPGNLTPEEITDLARTFAEAHQAEPLTLTHRELQEQGYLVDDGMYWEDGLLFSIDCNNTSGVPLEEAHFTAEKWRSGLGAYFFCNCTVTWSDNGAFQSYQVGAEAIS